MASVYIISLNIILDTYNKVMVFSPDYRRIMKNLQNVEDRDTL